MELHACLVCEKQIVSFKSFDFITELRHTKYTKNNDTAAGHPLVTFVMPAKRNSAMDNIYTISLLTSNAKSKARWQLHIMVCSCDLDTLNKLLTFTPNVTSC